MRKSKSKTKSRLYFFNHSVLSGATHGIQALHASVELLRKYLGPLNSERSVAQAKQVEHWADKDKTVVVLDGGITSDMNRINRLVRKTRFPWAQFREPDYGNMVTSIVILIPDNCHTYSDLGYVLCNLVDSGKLAK